MDKSNFDVVAHESTIWDVIFVQKFKYIFPKAIKLVIRQVKVLIENESLSIKLFLTNMAEK